MRARRQLAIGRLAYILLFELQFGRKRLFCFGFTFQLAKRYHYVIEHYSIRCLCVVQIRHSI